MTVPEAALTCGFIEAEQQQLFKHLFKLFLYAYVNESYVVMYLWMKACYLTVGGF